MSQQLYFSVLGQNLLQVLNDARRKDYIHRAGYAAAEDFIDLFDDDEKDEARLAEPSVYNSADGGNAPDDT